MALKSTMMVFIGILVGLFLMGALKNDRPADEASARSDARYEEILTKGILRCGYYLAQPIAEKNPDNGKMSGIGVALMEQVAKSANLRVEWAEEVQFGTMIAGLQSGRYDAVCTPAWASAGRAREALFTQPLFYSAIGVWVRKDDPLANKDMVSINDPSVALAVMDGDVTQEIASDLFPKGRQISFPSNVHAGELMLAVLTHKADVFFEDNNKVRQFLKKNPGSLKNVALHSPVRVYPFSFIVRKEAIKLRELLDVAAKELIATGYVDKLLHDYGGDSIDYLSVASGYRTGKDTE